MEKNDAIARNLTSRTAAAGPVHRRACCAAGWGKVAAFGDRLWGAAVHGAWRLDPVGMSALIAGADADRDQLEESFHRLDDELNGAVALVGGAVAQALDLFLTDAVGVSAKARAHASRTIEAARQALNAYENADEEMARHFHDAAQHQFQPSRFSARIPR